MLTIGSGGDKSVLPLMTSSFFLIRLSFFKFSSVQALTFSASSEALSISLAPTGILHVIHLLFSYQCTLGGGTCIINHDSKTYRSQNSSLRHTSINRQKWSYDIVHPYPLMTIFQRINYSISNVRVNIRHLLEFVKNWETQSKALEKSTDKTIKTLAEPS